MSANRSQDQKRYAAVDLYLPLVRGRRAIGRLSISASLHGCERTQCLSAFCPLLEYHFPAARSKEIVDMFFSWVSDFDLSHILKL